MTPGRGEDGESTGWVLALEHDKWKSERTPGREADGKSRGEYQAKGGFWVMWDPWPILEAMTQGPECRAGQ